MGLKDVLPISSLQEADALVTRPSWCPLPDNCFPTGRTPEEENLDLCCGVSHGKALQNGGADMVYARICAEPNEGEEECVPIMALDGTAAGIFLAMFAQAHSQQLLFLFDMYGGEDDENTTSADAEKK